MFLLWLLYYIGSTGENQGRKNGRFGEENGGNEEGGEGRDGDGLGYGQATGDGVSLIIALTIANHSTLD